MAKVDYFFPPELIEVAQSMYAEGLVIHALETFAKSNPGEVFERYDVVLTRSKDNSYELAVRGYKPEVTSVNN